MSNNDESNFRYFRPWNCSTEDEKNVLESRNDDDVVKVEKEDYDRDDNESVGSSSGSSNCTNESESINRPSSSSENLNDAGSLSLLNNFVFGGRDDYQRHSAPAAVEWSSPAAPHYQSFVQQPHYESNPWTGMPVPSLATANSRDELLTSLHFALTRVTSQDEEAKKMKKMRPKKFKCSYCEICFSNNGQLKGHLRIHTGERPFRCDVDGCGKSFTRNEELTRHKRIHTGIKPFCCPDCRRRFGRKDHLKKHTRTHENRNINLQHLQAVAEATVHAFRHSEYIFNYPLGRYHNLAVQSLGYPAQI